MTEILVSILLLLGAFFILVAAIGIIRFKDVLSRLHATTKATSFGILLLILAFITFYPSLFTIIKALLVIVFIYLTAPLAAHSIAKSYREDDVDITD